jgi:hypothetical protein
MKLGAKFAKEKGDTRKYILHTQNQTYIYELLDKYTF